MAPEAAVRTENNPSSAFVAKTANGRQIACPSGGFRSGQGAKGANGSRLFRLLAAVSSDTYSDTPGRMPGRIQRAVRT